MLTSTVDAYLYQEYANDDNLQSFIDAYNGISQYYVDWTNNTPLPIYTGLSGDLLDWVAEGLYGMARTSLASPATAALGPYNTEPFNVDVYGGYTPSTQTVYQISDDIFKRIITWNFYKGDGKRISMRWWKRRIMRFLLGVNGTDPLPSQTGFVVGCENTQAIGIVVTPNAGSLSTLTVTISESFLSTYAEVTPYVLQVFQSAFLSQGVLDLPLQYTYACNIVAPLVATVTPSSWILEGFDTAQVTGDSTVTTIAGSGQFSFAWTSNNSLIVVDSPTSSVTKFSLIGGIAGMQYTGLCTCAVTDLVTLQIAYCSVYCAFTAVVADFVTAVNGVSTALIAIAVDGQSQGDLLVAGTPTIAYPNLLTANGTALMVTNNGVPTIPLLVS